ncbi:triose-phosphate isomerase [Occultella glacieicola]|uniref:Triosephosphate isomerase n=1 Tax=Occultella glacieicola TaxID=2518684 RepID=A0ABY2E4L3_9MICO|nr:triose-phosphate isomerase [Occultella glacieicola]TDE94968.1 triose-phosphate isomerase [Occultella glacieicola]
MTEFWVGTSWKMTKTLGPAREFARGLRARRDWPVRPFVIPPATALATVAAELGPDSPVRLGAQNAHWEDAGAWTGEVSVPQVADAGATMLEIGHSERREHFAETDERVNLKVHAALRHGLLPLICVGESAEVRRAGGAAEFVADQVRMALAGVPDAVPALIAYEPIWAIGAAGRPAQPEAVAEIAATVAAAAGARATVLYGGSVDLGNAVDLALVPGIGGLFVGRAAWQVSDYLSIVDRVGERLG